MANFNLPVELLSYMGIDDKSRQVLVNSSEANTQIDGFTFINVYGGNGIRATLGEAYVPRQSFVCCGNNLNAQLQKNSWINENKYTSDGDVLLNDYFGDIPVVIITKDGVLQAFAPVFSDKIDLATFIRDLRVWNNIHHSDNTLCAERVEEIVTLAKFLYRNNPNKIKSTLDELD